MGHSGFSSNQSLEVSAIEQSQHWWTTNFLKCSSEHCSLGKFSDRADEFHHLIVCKFFVITRKNFILHFFCTKPNIFKFECLLQTSSAKMLENLGPVHFAASVCFQRHRSLFDIEPLVQKPSWMDLLQTCAWWCHHKEERMSACVEMAAHSVCIGCNALIYKVFYLCYYLVDLKKKSKSYGEGIEYTSIWVQQLTTGFSLLYLENSHSTLMPACTNSMNTHLHLHAWCTCTSMFRPLASFEFLPNPLWVMKCVLNPSCCTRIHQKQTCYNDMKMTQQSL